MICDNCAAAADVRSGRVIPQTIVQELRALEGHARCQTLGPMPTPAQPSACSCQHVLPAAPPTSARLIA